MSAAGGGRAARAARTAAPGAVVAVCTGHRCAGLRRLGGGEVLDEDLRAAVRSSSGGVLLSSPCVGRCEHGPVTVVGHHTGAGRGPGEAEEGDEPGPEEGPVPTVWLRESSDPRWREALLTWVERGATTGVRERGDGTWLVTGVPAPLGAAVIGCSTGGPLRRLEDPPGPVAGR